MTLVSEDVPGASPVTVWSLETTAASDVVDARPPDTEVELRVVTDDRARVSRECYQSVGDPWYWVDRIEWDDSRWEQWAERDDLCTVTCWADGEFAGYYELERQVDGDVEIAYIGLMTHAIGRGIGGWLLESALRHAWRLPGTRRVWVHTCTLDAPAALANYQARGMRIFHTETEWRLVTPPSRP
jgi:GNAT superfamily N-acetyltransferase